MPHSRAAYCGERKGRSAEQVLCRAELTGSSAPRRWELHCCAAAAALEAAASKPKCSSTMRSNHASQPCSHVGGEDLLGAAHTLCDEGAGQRLCHLAGADESNALVHGSCRRRGRVRNGGERVECVRLAAARWRRWRRLAGRGCIASRALHRHSANACTAAEPQKRASPGSLGTC